MSEQTKPDLDQLNFRVPRDMKRKLKAIAATQGVSVQELGADLIAIYTGTADAEIIERREKAAKDLGWCAVQGSNLRPLPCQGFAPDENGLSEPLILPIHNEHATVVPTPMPTLSSSNHPLADLPIAA